jgi:hypothetical protein
VKLVEEFNGPIVINDRADTIMEDVSPDRGEEETEKVVDSKYLQPRWCPPGLTRTQKQNLQWLRLAEMQEREQEKQRDELFNEIKPRTLPKQEWRWKQAPQHPMIKPATGSQTAAPDGQTIADSVPGGQTVPSGGQITQAKEGHSIIMNTVGQASSVSGQLGGQTTSPSGQITNSYSLTVRPPAPVGLTAISHKIGTSSGVDGTSSPIVVEEDTDDDLLDYEPSAAHDGIDVNVIYLSSTDYSLLEEEEASQLALGPQEAGGIRRSFEVVVQSWAPRWHTDGPHVG